MPKIDLDTAPVRTGSIYPEPYASQMAGRSGLRLGQAAGLTQFGVNIITLQPGAVASLRHWHLREDEFAGGYSLRLHNGQSWRAPAALWVQLQCVEQRSRVQVQMSLPAPKENRPALARLGRLVLSCLRQLSSSFKPGRRAA